jgi:methionyl-tRNA formyltransferase
MPIHWALLRGEAQTGVTIHWMTGRFDAGPIMARYAGVPLSDDMDDVTADGLIQELDLVARGLLPEALNKAAQGSLGAEQNEQEATYEPTMVSELATADWSRTAQEVRNVIRARRFGNYDPPGPIAEVAGRRISVLRTSLLAAAGLPVRCRDRPLWITKFIDLPNSE